MKSHKITEGSTTLCVPVQDENTQFPPGTAPVFYNNRMELNRDMTVLLLARLKPENYLDLMAATGVRGLRVAHECGIPVTINDYDPIAIELIKENATLIGGDINVTCSDANQLLCSNRFDAVDIDPFGSPIPFLDAASRTTRNYLFITATDTAPLCGAHFNAGVRRYFAIPKNTEYHTEVGLRILMGAIARDLVKYDRGMEPLLSFAKSHYFRTSVRILGKVKDADHTLTQIGYMHQCPHCLYRTEEKGSLIPSHHTCPRCGSDTNPIGPLWMGPLQDKSIIHDMQIILPEMQFGTSRQMNKLLSYLASEHDICMYYDYHIIARSLKISPPPMNNMIAEIQKQGYLASRTHFCVTGIKTNAPLDTLEELIIHWNNETLSG